MALCTTGRLEEPSLASALSYIITLFRQNDTQYDEQNRQLLMQQKQFEPLTNKRTEKQFRVCL
jgi:hypothetical protein